jgi:lipoic acid synthetase
MKPASRQRLPEWLRKGQGPLKGTHAVKRLLRGRGLYTVCEEARCPNMGECFERGTATFMIMGDMCTRDCAFCAVKTGTPDPLDPAEPARLAEQVREMGLRHAVITSVTRDDLPDGGAGHFARTIEAVRGLNPKTTIEVLTPDFEGREGDARAVCEARPDVFNHNVETVERLTPTIRVKARYERSLQLLSTARTYLKSGFIKSGLMVGLGESDREVEDALGDMVKAGCDVVTIGQYLPPSKSAYPVVKYVEPETFQYYEEIGLKLGIKHVFAGPLVRSSYLADQVILEV